MDNETLYRRLPNGRYQPVSIGINGRHDYSEIFPIDGIYMVQRQDLAYGSFHLVSLKWCAEKFDFVRVGEVPAIDYAQAAKVERLAEKMLTWWNECPDYGEASSIVARIEHIAKRIHQQFQNTQQQ